MRTTDVKSYPTFTEVKEIAEYITQQTTREL